MFISRLYIAIYTKAALDPSRLYLQAQQLVTLPASIYRSSTPLKAARLIAPNRLKIIEIPRAARCGTRRKYKEKKCERETGIPSVIYLHLISYIRRIERKKNEGEIAARYM